jgi:glutamate racemase
VGGLSILREIRRQLPREDLVYLADTHNLPYGPRSLAEVFGFSRAITGFFLELPVKMVVVACNTASAASLKQLRLLFPAIPFVGMEPAVKPAAHDSQTGKVGVLATAATFQGELYESVVERFAREVKVIQQPCPGLADFIEANAPAYPGIEQILHPWLAPLLAAGIDHLVLACTHYSLVKEEIQRLVGPGVKVIDPSPAIARRVGQVLAERGELAPAGGKTLFLATGAPAAFAAAAGAILGEKVLAQSAAPAFPPGSLDKSS